MMRHLFRALPEEIQEAVKSWHERARIRARHLKAFKQLQDAALGISAGCLNDIRSLEDWAQRRPVLHQELASMLGLEAQRPRPPVDAQITGTLERPAYRIEKLVFQSLPGLYVTANFYLPKDSTEPVPCIVYLCGHMPHPVGAKTQYQDRYLWYPSHGFACLAIDPLEFGEVPGLHLGTYNLNLWHWLSLGYTPAGVEVWNAMRGIDWLQSRPEVNGHRIGATGISGGGIMTWFLAAMDGRVAACVPSCSSYTVGTQASRRLVRQQCDCTFYPNTYQLDFPVVAALIAPRPLLITSGRRDAIFPPEGYHEVFRRAKRIYDLYSASNAGSDLIREVDANVGHTDPPLFLGEAHRWMQRWLQDNPAPGLDGIADTKLESPEDLACLDRMPPDALNYCIHDRFVPLAAAPQCTSLATWSKRRTQLRQQLTDTVFRWFPKGHIPYSTRTVYNNGVYIRQFTRFVERTFESEPGAPVRVHVFRPKKPVPNLPLLVVIRKIGECGYFPDVDELLPLLSKTAVVVLYPRFTERTLTPSEISDLERIAAVTGRTVAALQIWDVLRTIRWVQEEEALEPGAISVCGRDEAGIVGLYAALLHSRIGQVILRDPPASHWQRPALLSVLRITDIPEVAGALAPRRLTIQGELPQSFSLTRELYQLMGAEAQFRQVPSLTHALLEGPTTRDRPRSQGISTLKCLG